MYSVSSKLLHFEQDLCLIKEFLNKFSDMYLMLHSKAVTSLLGIYLLAVNTLHGKLLFVAGHAVVIVVFGDEALGANWLLAALAGEAGLMPAVSFMLHLPRA